MTILEQPTQEIEAEYGPELGTADWFIDPHRLHKLRYFDGSMWTDHVTHYGPTPCQGCH